jgi:hypothetical protein
MKRGSLTRGRDEIKLNASKQTQAMLASSCNSDLSLFHWALLWLVKAKQQPVIAPFLNHSRLVPRLFHQAVGAISAPKSEGSSGVGGQSDQASLAS